MFELGFRRSQFLPSEEINMYVKVDNTRCTFTIPDDDAVATAYMLLSSAQDILDHAGFDDDSLTGKLAKLVEELGALQESNSP